MSTGLQRIIENHDVSLGEGYEPNINFKYRSYSVSNLRGGIGKSTLSFNLAYLFTRHASTLIADLCPQRNLTEALMRGHPINVDIGDALLPKVSGPAFGEVPDDISYRISDINAQFKGARSGLLYTRRRRTIRIRIGPLPATSTSNGGRQHKSCKKYKA